MRILLQSPVKGHFLSVFSRFNRDLFEALKPPGIKMDILRFDGSKPGDIVHIRMKIPIIGVQEWISTITEDVEEENRAWFTDTGEKLPSFLRYWKHRHIVSKNGKSSIITDDITYRTPSLFFDYLMYPVIYLQFAMRGPVYKKFFSQLPSIPPAEVNESLQQQ
ncbi:MAG: hypothetical protein R3C61_22895 [Bacteroidia bacterium]